MANKLTGSYDAVAQISRRQINGLLSSLHQNGASDQPPLRLGHNWVLQRRRSKANHARARPASFSQLDSQFPVGRRPFEPG